MPKPIDQAEFDNKPIVERQARRPWHAPQFMLTEVALTDNQAATNTDPALTAQS